MKHIYWFDLKSPLEEFLVPTFIVGRLLYVKKSTVKPLYSRHLSDFPIVYYTEMSTIERLSLFLNIAMEHGP